MEIKERIARKEHNWGYLLFFCAAVFFVVSRRISVPLFALVYPFFGTIAQPGLILLIGRMARRWRHNRKELICAGAGMILLGYAQKILIFWFQTWMGLGSAFYPFSTTGVSWIFLVGGTYMIITGLCRKWQYNSVKLLALAGIIGLAGGLVKPFDGFLCLAQLCAYAPFYVVGWRLRLRQLRRWSTPNQKRTILAAAVGAVSVIGTVLARHELSQLWGIIEGDCWYGECERLAHQQLLGPMVRLSWYLVAFALLWAMFVLVPAVRVPVFSQQGKRPLYGYFWFTGLSYLTTASLVTGKVTLVKLLLCGALTALVYLIAPCKRGEAVLERLLTGPGSLLTDEVPMERTPRLGKVSFYQRHKWGVDTCVLFTLLFLVVAVGFVYPFADNGRSLIWNTDGMGQQYPMMFYFKEYVLDSLKHLHFSSWDFTLGFGMSPLDALRREPFMLMALLGNEKTMEVITSFSEVFRLYVCGLTFIWYCHTIGKTEKVPVVMGALVYSFCGFALFAGVRQPYFSTVLMTYLVFMFIGVERYLRQGKYGLFVFSVFLQLFGAYYSSYINGLLLAVYLLVRLGCKYKTDIRSIVLSILKFIGYYAWGAAMAMVTFLPGIISLFSSSREQSTQSIGLFYNNTYYRNLITGLNLEFGGVGYWVYISCAALGWLSVLLLFLRHRKELMTLKAGIVSLFFLLTFPIFGMIANGFAYVSNRWCFAIPLVVALILVEMAPELIALSQRDKGVILAIVLVYGAVSVTRPELLGSVRLIGIVELCLTTLVVLLLDQFAAARRMRMAVLCFITTLTLTMNCAVCFLPNLGDYVKSFQGSTTAYEVAAGTMEEGLQNIDDESFYRVGKAPNSANQSMALGYYPVNSYYSVNPEGISDYATDICLADQIQTFRINGLDGRAVPETLASVKYFVATPEDKELVPYGFSVMKELDNGAKLYKNENYLPLGYTYDSYVTYDEFMNLLPLERQQIMLDGVVIDGEPEGLTKVESKPEMHYGTCSVKSTKDVKVNEEKQRLAIKDEGSIKFSFEGEENCETYLVLQNLRYTDPKNGKDCGVEMKGSYVTVDTNVRGKQQSYYFYRDAVIFHLGYSESAQSECTIKFNKDADMSYDSIYMVYIPVEGYEEKVDALRQDVLEDIVETGDRITGTIDLQESKLLVLSVPYTNGWKARVDGEEAQVLQANVAYCGLMLDAGKHTIELYYEHPGLRAGGLISAVSIAAVLPVWIISSVRRRKKDAARQETEN